MFSTTNHGNTCVYKHIGKSTALCIFNMSAYRNVSYKIITIDFKLEPVLNKTWLSMCICVNIDNDINVIATTTTIYYCIETSAHRQLIDPEYRLYCQVIKC